VSESAASALVEKENLTDRRRNVTGWLSGLGAESWRLCREISPPPPTPPLPKAAAIPWENPT
jgi:hypothetical protein